MAYTLGDIGDSESVVGDNHITEGQIDVPFTVTARQAVTTAHVEKFFDTSPAPVRVDVTDPALEGDVPEPYGGFDGEVIYQDPQAMDPNGEPFADLDGRPGQGHGGFAIGVPD